MSDGKEGVVYRVRSVKLPLQTQKRMQALGMTYDTRVEILHRKGSGTMVVLLRGTRFAIGRGISGKIQVCGEEKS